MEKHFVSFTQSTKFVIVYLGMDMSAPNSTYLARINGILFRVTIRVGKGRNIKRILMTFK